MYHIFNLLALNTNSIDLKKYSINGKTYYNTIMQSFGFQCGRQEDAQEAYSYILDYLLSSQLIVNFKKYFQLNSEIKKTCENNKTFTKRDESYILSLPIDKDNKNNVILSSLIDKYTSYEYIKPEDRELLDACKDSAGNRQYPIGSQITLMKNDNIKNLVINLKRFDFSTGVAVRLNNVIQVPKYLVFNDQVYELKGMGLHLGSDIGGGHYVYINSLNNKRYLYDDSTFSEYTIDNLDISKNAYIINYEKAELSNKDYANIYYNQFNLKYNRLTNVDFVLGDIYNINNSVNNFKKELIILRNKYYGYLTQPRKNNIDLIEAKIIEKQGRLNKYDKLNELSYFNSTIPELSIVELENSLTNNGLMNLKNNKTNFSYQKPNSASKSNIFRGFWDGKKCFMKTFTIYGNQNLKYEQKVYRYIDKRNTELSGEFSDNFVNVYRIFKIKRNDFKNFYNTKTFQGTQVRFTDNYGYAGEYIKYDYESYIYFIVTEDISGSTVSDFYQEQCKLFIRNAPDKYKYRDNIMEMLFELVYGLYLLNTRLNVIHNDNHFGNLLIKEQPEQKLYTINKVEYERKRKYRVCIYDFDLSYFEGNTNQDPRLVPNNRTNQINSVVPLTDINKGRDIYTIGNSLFGFSMYLRKTLNVSQFNELCRNSSGNMYTYNVFKILFETDKVINNLVQNFEYDTKNNKLFWNSYCVTGKTPCLPVDFNNITAEKVLTRMLNSNDLKRILNVINVDPLFKKYLKYKLKYIKYINENKN